MRIIKYHRVFFSAAVACRHSKWNSVESQFHFGPSGSPHGAGFNFELWVGVEGRLSEESGWIVSEEELHGLVWKQAKKLDHCAVHQVVAEFRKINPTTENLAVYLFWGLVDLLKNKNPSAEITRLRLIEGENTWVDIIANEWPTIFLTRSYRIHAVHRHHNPNLTSEENLLIYNKCSSLHGHEYIVEVSVKGEIDAQTDLLLSRGVMDKQVQENIVEPYNMTFLNEVLGNTSGEVLTVRWSQILRNIWDTRFCQLVVRETRKNSFVEASSKLDRSLMLL